jgi:DNA-binding NtrC family response regulator
VQEKKKILVIDDELLIRDLLYDFFAEKGWEVEVSDSGTSGQELLRNRKFDFALIDLKMPEMDGLALIRKIKALYPEMPVAIMTAFPSFETAVDALRLKVDDYFTKPFNINQLYKTIDHIVEAYRSGKKQEDHIKAEEYQ